MECFRVLIEKILECLLGHQLREEMVSAHTMTLFNDVYVRPNVAYNFLHYLGITAFGVDKYHTRESFFTAYEKSNVLNHLRKPDKESAWQVNYFNMLHDLDTPE